MSDLKARKSALRAKLRRQRAALSPAVRRRAAAAAARHAARFLRCRHARRVAIYVGFQDELATAPLIRALLLARHHVYVPKVRKPGVMHFVRLRPGAALRRNRYGIPEPVAAPRAARLDAAVVPLVAFDAQGHRLGTGGGYYDRALAAYRLRRRPLRLGYAYAVQETPDVPVAIHDLRLDAVATEHGVRRFREKPWPTG